MKLSHLLSSYKVVSSGFAAITGLSAHSKGTEEVVLSSLAPSILAEQGVTEYFALELERGTVFNMPEEIIAANPVVRKFKIEIIDTIDLLPYANPQNTIIVSRHHGTVDILKKDYWLSPVFDAVTPEQIAGKHVVGTLPPHLITAAGAYTAVTIRGFDYNKDGDLSGDELHDRMIVGKTIKLKEI